MNNDIKNKVMNLIMMDLECLKEIINKEIPLDIIIDKEEDKFILEELFNWYKKYNSKPVLATIFNELNKISVDKALLFKMRVSSIKDIKVEKDEFNFLIEQLKLEWGKTNIQKVIKDHLASKNEGFNNLDQVTTAIKKLNNDLLKIDRKINKSVEGEYSYTTKNVEGNIESVKQRDLSTLKRFKIGHDVLDNETGGFLYGEVFIIVANVNQGKTMLLANAAYNLWLSGANILILTAEMRPTAFDDRIYSRASAVLYSHIINGKTHLSEEDIQALEIAKKYIKKQPNQIITKWLNNSDNVNTVSKYIEDLEKTDGFVPDVLIIDSLECLSPAIGNKNDLDWLDKGEIIIEFKNFAEEFKNKRGLLVISTHQAKGVAEDKEFKDITLNDMGRSKIVAEKADAAIYERCQDDLKRMNVKVIKARRFSKELSYNMSYDFSRVMINNIENDTITT